MNLVPAFNPPHKNEHPKDTVMRIEKMSEISSIPFQGGKMTWHVWGNGDPLILLHGGYGSWMHWIKNIPILAANFQVFAVDMPGFGSSDDMPEPHTASNIATFVSDAIDKIVPKDKPLHQIGFSFGGIIGGNVAALQGDRMLSHTFSGSSGMGLSRNALETFASWRAAKTDEEKKAAHRKNLEILMIAKPEKIDELALYVQAWNTGRGRVRSHKMGSSDNLTEALCKVKARLMGLYGNCDAYAKGFLHERINYLTKFQSNLIFREIAGAGHWGCYEAPNIFNQSYLQMINEINT